MSVYTHLALYCLSFIVLFVALSTLAAVCLPSVLRLMQDVIPEQRAQSLGLMAIAPLLISSMTSSLLFSPLGNQFIHEHCHLDECGRHIPFTTAETWLFSLAPFSIVLGILVVFLMMKLLSQYWQQTRLWRKFSHQENGYFLIEHDAPVAFTLGLFRSHIYLSRGLIEQLDREDIEVVIQHETAHMKRHDNFFRLIVSMSTVLFMKRARMLLLEQFNLAQEMACDNYAAKAVNDKLTVAQTLLKVNRCITSNNDIALCHISGNGTKIEQRIKALLKTDIKTLHLVVLPLISLSVLGLPSLLLGPVHHILEHIF